jgi:dynein heavy chain, axonemal
MGDYNTAAASMGAQRNNFMSNKESENNYGLDNIRVLQGPPSVSVTGFEGGYSLGQKNIEMARSKFLVDKLTGKLSEDLLSRKKSRPNTAFPGAGALPPRRPSQRSQVSVASSALAKKKKDEDEDEEEEKVAQPTNQKWSDLDKCIELLLDSKSEEETVFVYLNTNPNADPYDLLVANYQERDAQKYYTLSGKGLTLYVNDTPIEFLSLGQWLIERDSYNHIKELNFFKKFKKWKFMRMWKKTIKH